jgi:hypothetical protein
MEKSTNEQSCYRCGRNLAQGELKYAVHIKVYAFFDGFLSAPEEDLEREMDQILEEIKLRDPEELEKEVFQEIGLLLCKTCRDRFVRETTEMSLSDDGSVMIH